MKYTLKEYADMAYKANKEGMFIGIVNGELVLKDYPKKSLEETKRDKLAEIKQAFQDEQNNGSMTSSLGFAIDANRISKDNIDSLLYVGLFPVTFRDYNNEYHSLWQDDLITLKKELIAHGNKLYQKKWRFEEIINNAETIEEVEVVRWEE